MPKFVGDDISVVVGGVDLSDHVRTVDVKDAYSPVDVSGMGANAQQNVLPKRKVSSIEIEFIQDYASSKVAPTLEPLVGSNTGFTVTVIPVASQSVSATNQKYQMVSLLPEWDYVMDGSPALPKAGFVSADSTGISKASS